MRRPLAALLLTACAVTTASAPPSTPQSSPRPIAVLPSAQRDYDGDGFVDPRDRCPRVIGGEPDGCPPPDSDGDLFPDAVDLCRAEAGGKPYGCPDADADTIPDKFDRCVTAREVWNGLLDHDGCPDEVPKELRRILGVARGVTFKKDWILEPRSHSVLDRIAAVLARYPDVRIAVVGHSLPTDMIEYSWIPSKHRASTVVDYLVKHGVPRARLKPMDSEEAFLWDAPRDHDIELLLIPD